MAGSLNKVMLIGRLGADPKLSYLPSGQPVANFNVATDDSYKDRNTGEKVERTEWHRVAVYGKSAEFCANYLTKGRLVYIEGTLRTRKWQDRDGADRWTTEVIVNPIGGRVDGLDRPNQGGPGADAGGYEDRPQRGNYGGGQGGGGGGRGPQQPQRGKPRQQQPGGYQEDDEDLGPAFPSEASGMDDVPF